MSKLLVHIECSLITGLFTVDCSGAGKGELGIYVVHDGQRIPTRVINSQSTSCYQVTFTPLDTGAYEVNVHFNRAEVTGITHWLVDDILII